MLVPTKEENSDRMTTFYIRAGERIYFNPPSVLVDVDETVTKHSVNPNSKPVQHSMSTGTVGFHLHNMDIYP
ncbi:hypothetical protein FNV43_RR11185 [Rhamnella rubrinervis]|uniref:Uncharacterized protein n=1 Tax=Rhamnella rubrinervis TaxID=2594499 RepID=A0A8K0H581_9ROSA|nr:hypothetical protein FNV43_RR11185 [Rhamnella rubrinervis]